MCLKRLPTGIEGLDSVIEGGFPKGSLVLLAGNPGTGKTVFSAKFLYHGAVDCMENGVYASFAEGKEHFVEYMRRFGMDFEELEKEGKVKVLDLITVREPGVSDVLNRIVEDVLRLKAKRLVIDSLSALAQAFREKIDVRVILHTILNKIVKSAGCTTIVIVEVPYGERHIGFGIEEFVADAVILLYRGRFEHTLLREMEIMKLRGTRITHSRLSFTLEGGFHVFLPLIVRGIRKPVGRYELIAHQKDHFSTGIRDLDRILKGLFHRGGYNLLEVENDVAFPIERLIRPTVCNFLNQGHGVLIVPPQGVSAETVRNSIAPYVEERLLNQNLKVVEYKVEGERPLVEPYLLLLKGESITEDLRELWDATLRLKKNTGKPVFSVVGYDTIEYTYGEKEALKTLGEDVARIRNLGDLRVNIIRPTVYIADQLRALAHIHLKVAQIDGALFLYGIKPRTSLLNIDLTAEEGVSKVKLTPIV